VKMGGSICVDEDNAELDTFGLRGTDFDFGIGHPVWEVK